MLGGQFRLFFVWLTKSLRQLNGDMVPQSNQLPVINRLVTASTACLLYTMNRDNQHLGVAPLARSL